jgi:dihydrolipoamide dehydrogenase
MAEVAVKVLLGNRSSEMVYHAIPWALYTWPEVAGCGYTEEEAVAKGMDVVCATALMRLSARYYAENGNTPGMVKVVVRKDDKTIVGVQMVGGTCSEMIWGATMAVQLRLTVDQVVETIFPHPTIGEVLRDVLLQLQ